MAKSVRLSRDEEHRIRQAAQRRGMSDSEVIREALRKHCEEVLGEPDLQAIVKDILATYPPGEPDPGPRRTWSRKTGKVFGDQLSKDSGHGLE